MISTKNIFFDYFLNKIFFIKGTQQENNNLKRLENKMRSLLLEAELAPINSDIQKQNLKIERLQNKTESKNEFKKSPLTIFLNNFLFIKETNEDNECLESLKEEKKTLLSKVELARTNSDLDELNVKIERLEDKTDSKELNMPKFYFIFNS